MHRRGFPLIQMRVTTVRLMPPHRRQSTRGGSSFVIRPSRDLAITPRFQD
jgi:hypothetical protein